MKTFERRYHATWVLKDGLSALAKLGAWMVEHRATLQMVPRHLLEAAVREPTRRHRKHFAWLLKWHQCLVAAIGGRYVPSRGSQVRCGDRGSARALVRIPDMGAEL